MNKEPDHDAMSARDASFAIMLNKLWPTPLADSLSCAQVATLLGVSNVAAANALATMKTAGLVSCRSDGMNDRQRDSVLVWDSTDAGDALIASFYDDERESPTNQYFGING